jgi:hypothetical protein
VTTRVLAPACCCLSAPLLLLLPPADLMWAGLLQVPLDLHLESCEKKFAEIQALTGEECGPFGTDYLERYRSNPIVAATCKRLQQAVLPKAACKFTPDGVMIVRGLGGLVRVLMSCRHSMSVLIFQKSTVL